MKWNKTTYYIYITTNFTKTVLYTGVTNNLEQRITEHYLSSKDKKSFTGKYNAFYVLYYESHQYVENAIVREKEIKGWRREKENGIDKNDKSKFRFFECRII